MDENTTETKTTGEETTEEKQSTKTWTQSEVDKHAAALLNREKEKYSDYDTMKQTLESLMQEKTEKENANKSELEKAMDRLQTLEQRNEELESMSKTLELEKLKNNVLSDPKYSDLPKAYKSMVTTSSNEEEVRAMAEAALEEYKNDFTGKTSEQFGIPAPKKETKFVPTEVINDPTTLANALRERVSNLLKK